MATRLDTPELTFEDSGASGKVVLGCAGMVLSSAMRRDKSESHCSLPSSSKLLEHPLLENGT